MVWYFGPEKQIPNWFFGAKDHVILCVNGYIRFAKIVDFDEVFVGYITWKFSR